MKIGQQQVGTVDVFTPVGALTEQDGQAFSKLLLQRLRTANPRVVVDLHEVSYLDSVALESLLDATAELGERASALKLANTSPTCREILELTGLAPRFCFFNDVQTAVKSFL